MSGKETEVMNPLVKAFKRNQRLYKDVKKWAEGFDKKITNWSFMVNVHHEDGSHAHLENCFPVKVTYRGENIYVVFTEHFGIYIIFVDDCNGWNVWGKWQSYPYYYQTVTYDKYKLIKTRKGKFKVTNAQ